MKVQWTNDYPELGEYYWFTKPGKFGNYTSPPKIVLVTENFVLEWPDLIAVGWVRSYHALKAPGLPTKRFEQ